MTPQTKLSLLRAMRVAKKSDEGFTLVEVLVVAGILAILFASLVPNLLAARGRAQATAYVSEAIGIARACQGVVASGLGSDDFISPADGTSITCDGVNASVSGDFVSKTWTRVLTSDDGIVCPDPAQTTLTGAGAVTITVDTATNQLSCTVA